MRPVVGAAVGYLLFVVIFLVWHHRCVQARRRSDQAQEEVLDLERTWNESAGLMGDPEASP